MPNISGSEPVPINVVGSSTFGRYSRISNEQTYNMFLSDNWLVNFPGYKKTHQFIEQGIGRGQYRSIRGNFMICVVNEGVYLIDRDFTVTQIGIIATFEGPVFIDENLNFQICIVDGVNAYIYNYATASAITVQVLNPNLTPNYVVYHNTFFLFGNTNQVNQSSSWFAYRFATATTIAEETELALQTKPDFPIAVKRIPGQSANVLVFGSTVCEVFTQVGGLQNYRRVNSVSVDYGCLSVTTIDSSDTMIAWLAINESNAPVIMVFSGQGAVPISTDGIDYLLSRVNEPQRSTGSFVRFDGHLMYQLTFYHPTDNFTLIYDFNTQKFFNLSDQYLNFHPALDYSYFDGKTYFLSLTNAAIYEISSDITVIDENIIESHHPDYDTDLVFETQKIRITGNYSLNTNDRFTMKTLSLIVEQGSDPRYPELPLPPQLIITEAIFDPPGDIIVTEQGAPLVVEGAAGGESSIFTPRYIPRIDLSVSKDGAITWSSIVGRNLNPIGHRKNILRWDRIGRANVVTFKFRFWGTSRVVVNDASLWTKRQ